jgi:CheY-like chemotaxis protein
MSDRRPEGKEGPGLAEEHVIETNQTLADNEQTLADRDQTASDRDQQETPDLALLDVQMRELDGSGLAAALVEDERTQQLRFVFTGDPDPYVEALAYEAGALGFIAKPFDPRDIGSFVNRALAHLAPRKSVAA